MALQNTRALLFRGEDGSYGGSAAKEVVWTSTAPAAGRPLVVSLAFLASTTQLNPVLGTSAAGNVAAAMGGLSRILVNRSPRFWMTLTCQLGQANSAAGTYTVALPVGPRQLLFLPHHVFAGGTSQLQADNAWPLTLPPNAGGNYVPPVAGSTAALAFDFLAEQ